MTQLLLREKLFVPIKLLKRSSLEEYYTRRVFKEHMCMKCPYLEDRFGENCEECPNYLGLYKLYSRTEIDNKDYYGVPTGNRVRLRKLLPKLRVWRKQGKIKDMRPRPPLRHKWKLIKPLWEYQKAPINDIVKKGYGQLESPPRSGKSLMMIKAAIDLGLKTLIMAHQTELLTQFMENMQEFTNLNSLEERTGRKLAGICLKPEQFKQYDFCMVNYQQFIQAHGEKRLARIRDMFGTVIVDETHHAAARCYSKVVNNINSRHKLGCTGTIDRKDGLHFIVEEVIGPVVAFSDVQMLVPTFEFVRTPVDSSRVFQRWDWFIKYLVSHKERNALIVQEAIKYVKQGRSVVIPITLVKHARLLADEINKKYGQHIAVAFTGHGNTKETRKAMILAARAAKKTRVVIGMRSLIQEGINVPIWSVLLEVMPISNPPKFKQETARICTPMEGKPRPIIRMFCDDIGISRGCMRTCFWQGAIRLGFSISREDKARFISYCKGNKPQGTFKVGKRF